MYFIFYAGLQELVLSGNPRISPRSWEKFSVALSACSTIRSLYLDFNNVGATAGKMLVVCAAGHKSLNVLDMEACDLSESVGRVSRGFVVRSDVLFLNLTNFFYQPTEIKSSFIIQISF